MVLAVVLAVAVVVKLTVLLAVAVAVILCTNQGRGRHPAINPTVQVSRRLDPSVLVVMVLVRLHGVEAGGAFKLARVVGNCMKDLTVAAPFWPEPTTPSGSEYAWQVFS